MALETQLGVRVEHGVDVGHDQQLGAALAEAPHQVPGGVAAPGARCAGQAMLEPLDPLLLGARRGGDRGEGGELDRVDHAITAVASISTSHSGRASASTTSPVETGCTPFSHLPTTV